MATREWTPAQAHCITARGGDILVSAAAGSGKTSVLVERVIGRMTDPVDPVDIDRMLIVTYTKAAAAEMKQRLASRLNQSIAADPQNQRLQQQQLLLPTAMITTIDGFCVSVLREYFQPLGLSPHFRVIEDTQEVLLRNEALDEVLEVFYAAAEDGFLQLCDLLGGRRDDSSVKTAVLDTYNTIQAQVSPLSWLHENCHMADAHTALGNTLWGQLIRRYTADALGMYVEMADRVSAPLRDMPEAAAYVAKIQEYASILERAALTVADDTNTWDLCIRTVQDAIPHSLPANKKLDAAYTQSAKATFSIIREGIRKKILPLFGENEATALQDVLDTQPKLQALCDLLAAFTERYAQKKAEKQLVDFSDVEHFALQLLYDPAEEKPTALAGEISARYREIFIDEYQDTNTVQDTLFRMLRHRDNTLFMVGDVKQSIYGFRQAMPEIFLQKKSIFAPFDGQTYPACITLGDNFRSRREVTDTVNFVFEQLMTAPFCGMDYTGDERLHPSAVYPPCDDTTEVLLLDDPFPEKEIALAVLEARLIVTRIRELMANGQQVTENGVMRQMRYSDICILLRSRSDRVSVYAAELAAAGIPVMVDTGSPFFEAEEIRRAIALLQAVDNPLRDVALMAVMLSPVGGFTADDCAAIRAHAQHSDQKVDSLYAMLLLANTETADLPPKLKTQITAFLQCLSRYRRLAVSLPADALLSRLLEETPFMAAAAAGKHGETRVANLHRLLQMARTYEQNGYRGLSGFVRQLDRLREEKPRLLTDPPGVQGDAVHMMTIHGSKGLEFPIVFMSHLFGEFNREDTRQSLLLHGTAGVALTGYSEQDLTAFRTVSQNGVLTAMRYTAAAEELRVLYVAMTRAKEKLILVLPRKNLPAHIEKLARYLPKGVTADTPRMLSLGCFADWLLLAFLRHPDAALLRHLAGDDTIETLPAPAPLACRILEAATLLTPPEDTAAALPPADAQMVEKMREKFAFAYPYTALQTVPVKLAASALSHRETAAAYIATRRPAFLAADGLTPAERGTALHTFMQFADYTAAAQDLTAEADRLEQQCFLSPAQRAALPLDKLRRFFDSALYHRMCDAKRIWREYPFTVPMPARIYDPALPSDSAGEPIIVQGIADCVFEEDGALVIVDYKTDRLPDAAALTARYQKQLDIYRQALTETFGLPVKQTVLYAFALDRTVEIFA